jgi:hypothetical protein
MDLQVITRKFLNMLPDGNEMPLPRLQIVDRLTENWNGIAIWEPKHPIPGLIQVQKKVTDDKKTLERIVAHEVCHYWSYQKIFVLGEEGGHGHVPGGLWDKAAKIINNKMNDEEFITETSDASYVTKSKKTFYVLIVQGAEDRLGWIWFSRVSPVMKKELDQLLTSKPVAIVRTDRDVFVFSGAKLPRIGLTEDPSVNAILEEWYVKYAQQHNPADLAATPLV